MQSSLTSQHSPASQNSSSEQGNRWVSGRRASPHQHFVCAILALIGSVAYETYEYKTCENRVNSMELTPNELGYLSIPFDDRHLFKVMKARGFTKLFTAKDVNGRPCCVFVKTYKFHELMRPIKHLHGKQLKEKIVDIAVSLGYSRELEYPDLRSMN